MTTFAPTTSATTGAHVGTEHADAWLACAEMAVLGGLTAANKRLMRKQGRSVRHHTNGLRDTETWLWHTIIPTQALRDVDVDELLVDSLAVFDAIAFRVNPEIASCLRVAILTYMRTVIAAGIGHDPAHLARMIERAGCLHEETPAA